MSQHWHLIIVQMGPDSTFTHHQAGIPSWSNNVSALLLHLWSSVEHWWVSFSLCASVSNVPDAVDRDSRHDILCSVIRANLGKQQKSVLPRAASSHCGAASVSLVFLSPANFDYNMRSLSISISIRTWWDYSTINTTQQQISEDESVTELEAVLDQRCFTLI